MELGELWDRLASSTELWAALLGALVGGIASGAAALGGSLIVEKMKHRKSARVRMYEELLPPVREAATWYKSEISKDERPEPRPIILGTLTEHTGVLEHVSAMAGRRDRQLAHRIADGVREQLELSENEDNWEETKDELGDFYRKWVGDSDRLRALIWEIDKDLAALEARLRKKVD